MLITWCWGGLTPRLSCVNPCWLGAILLLVLLMWHFMPDNNFPHYSFSFLSSLNPSLSLVAEQHCFNFGCSKEKSINDPATMANGCFFDITLTFSIKPSASLNTPHSSKSSILALMTFTVVVISFSMMSSLILSLIKQPSKQFPMYVRFSGVWSQDWQLKLM